MAINSVVKSVLNQVHTSHRPARAWFLEIAFVREVSMRVYVCVRMCVCVCVCVSILEAMKNKWRDMKSE